ncbi:hypothetical protein [Flavobacterium silvaticum]|uniref:Uncharacterized protein n=1 Tax=Flavobacterium silvaticum TaxID=1852020 RepID=A0A972JI08_9FLAO|nr:hypothetical protein [Flavobacterium silvaticum]NMH28500.1 hypothetical protein [Flavobacterium silvaticum]
MKIFTTTITIIFLFSFEIGISQHERDFMPFPVDNFFLDQLDSKLTLSKVDYLQAAQQKLIKNGVSEENLKSKEIFIKNADNLLSVNNLFFQSWTESRHNKLKITNLFFITVTISGDELTKYNIVLSKDVNNQIEIYSSDKKSVMVSENTIDFITDYMLNLCDPSNYKTPPLNAYMTIDNIRFYQNEFVLRSVVVESVLNKDLMILKNLSCFK